MNFGKTVEKNRIRCSSAHRVFISKFQILAESFLNPNLKSNLTAATRDALRHGRIYGPVAREKHFDVMKFHLNTNTCSRNWTGVTLFWLAASPDGVVSD